MKIQDINQPVLSGNGTGETFDAVATRHLSRRSLLKGSAAVAAGAVFAPGLAKPTEAATSFSSLPTSTADLVQVAPGHAWAPLLKWGDPVVAGAPAFNVNAQTPQAQALQSGYNCDFLMYVPLPLGSNNPNHGLLWVNHEYTNPEMMFAGWNRTPTREQADIQLAAHGASVVEIQKGADGRWAVVPNSSYGRRITAETPMELTGPVRGSDWAKTGANPDGTSVKGMLNNCGGGVTPWGTVLTCEENFQGYFANLNRVPDGDPRRGVNQRYGVSTGASRYLWERYHSRFDMTQETNEPNRFGYVVEVDPYNPNFTPRKRTALGRMLHEAATSVVAPNGRVVVYTGDDARFEYVYKFVTNGTYNAGNRDANMNLLDDGTLYVAKFNDDGSGVWMPLVFGQGPLTAANQFYNQADVLVQTRRAGDVLGATKMDRPEDIETNSVNKKVYIALTNNSNRTAAQVDKANPRAENRHGHVIELTEAGNDPSALSFQWNLFLVCGEPNDPSTYFAGYPKSGVSSISSPDNVLFDSAGNLWICSDGQPSSMKVNDSVYAVPVAGPERGRLRRFMNAVPDAEVAAAIFTPDDRTLFVSIQHPGEDSSFEQPTSTFPDGGVPRPTVIQVWSTSGDPVGQVGGAADAPAGVPSALPRTGESPFGLGGLGVAAGVAAAAAGGLLRLRSRRVVEPKD